MSIWRHAFAEELIKLSAAAPAPPMSMALRMPKVPRPRVGGAFGIADNYTKVSEHPETMSRPKWMRTLVDVPLSIGAMSVGYGVGRLAAEAALAQVSKNPKAMAKLPHVIGVSGAITGLGLTGLRGYLRRRREDAEREAP